jgi:MFS family permease
MMTLPLILQIVKGASPTEAGLLMIPMTIGMMTASMGSGIITGRTGKYKIFMVVGTAMMTVSYVYFAQMKYDWEIWQISIGMVVMGLGLGQLMQTLTIAAQNAVEPRDIGVATSSATFFRQMGGTAGVAVFLSILFATLADKGSWIGEQIKSVLMAKPELLSLPENAILQNTDTGGIADMVATDSSFLQTISAEISEPILIAFTEAGVTVFTAAAAVIFIGFILTWFVKEVPLRQMSGVAAKAEEEAKLSGMH